MSITEVQGMEGDVIVMQDVFVFEQTGVNEGRIEVGLADRHSAQVRGEVRGGWHPSAAEHIRIAVLIGFGEELDRMNTMR